MMTPTSRSYAAPEHRQPAGFTLVEILGVLTLIVSLAALLLPILASVREAGHRVGCAGNLMQIGLAMRQYTDDNAGFIVSSDLPNGDQNCSWVDRVYPYAQTSHIFECPSHPDGEYQPGCPPSDAAPISEDNPLGKITYDGSYMLNTMVFPPHRVRRSQVVYPESTIQVIDGKGNITGPDPKLGPGFAYAAMMGNNFIAVGQNPIPNVDELLKAGLANRHRGGVNALFADGHVKWLRLEALTKRGLWRLDGRDNPPDPPLAPTPTPYAP
ncbi:MAG: hypothetical protein JO316_23985 [Abitibacteriaceae bacterium]|nr:hypothetical protein [Abditibacteriaceae bacterium]